jgi:hypothetical protein
MSQDADNIAANAHEACVKETGKPAEAEHKV